MPMNHVSKQYEKSQFFPLRFVNEWLYNTGTQAIAFLFAFFSIVGRWEIGRLSGIDGDGDLFGKHLLFQPRLWSLVGLVIFTLLFFRVKNDNQQSLDDSRSDDSLPKERNKKIFILQIILWTYLLISSLWMYYSDEQLIRVYDCALLILFVSCAFMISNMKNRDELIQWIWFYLVFIASVMFVVSLPAVLSGGMTDEGEERLAVLGGGPNIYVRFVGVCLINSIYLCFKTRLLRHVFFIPLFVCAIVLTGSRGGMLAVSVSVALLLYLEGVSIKKMFFLAFGVFCIGIVAMLISPNLMEGVRDTVERRITQKTFEDGSLSGREINYYNAYTHGMESPVWGHGMGSWRYYEGETYPHNLFLELFYESGLISVILCTIMIIMALTTIKFIHKRKRLRSQYVCYIVMIFVAAMLSGDIFDNRCFFAMLFFSCVPCLETQD